MAQSESTALFLTNIGSAGLAQLGSVQLPLSRNRGGSEGWREGRREGWVGVVGVGSGGVGEKEEDDSFPSLSPGSQAFSLTGVTSVASSSVSTFLSFIFTRRAPISWPAEGICRGGRGWRKGARAAG